jgi:signal peptidase I
MRCSKCGTDNAPNTRFCSQCATPFIRPCPKCAYENAPESKFCGQCAAPLQADSIAPQSPLNSSAATPAMKPRRVGIALVLSLLFLGWGQIYNGQFRKALWVWGGWIIAYLCAVAVGLPATLTGLLGLLFAAVFFYVLVCVEAVVRARQLSLKPHRFTPNRWYAYLGFAAIVYLLILSAALVSRRFFFQAYKIPSAAMEPTLLIGDHLVVDKRPGTPHRGDVIVFVFPADRSKDFIKRVIAVGGDSVEVRNGIVFLNGRQIPDPHSRLEVALQDRSPVSPRDNFGPVMVPAGKLFVMGDNRDRSYDSRYWGFVAETDVEGRALYLYWSLDEENSSTSVTRVRWERVGMSVQ